MTFVAQAVIDRPLGLWAMDDTTPFQDYSGYNRAASVVGTPVQHASLAAGAAFAQIFHKTLVAQFDSPVFVKGQESAPFSLEAWIKTVDKTTGISVQQVLSHSAVYDGLTTNGTVVSFTTKYATAPDATVSYDLQILQAAHVVGVHTDTKNQLYVNGSLVAEADLTSAQIADTYIVTDGKLYSGLTTGNQHLALGGVAIYSYPLSQQTIAEHYMSGTQTMPSESVPAAFGGEKLSLVSTNSVTRLWSDLEDWATGATTAISIQSGDLRPTFIADVSQAGNWLTVFPLDSLPTTTINGINLFWSGTGAVVEVSLNGTVWETAVQGKNVALITPGFTTTDKVLHIRVSFPGGITNDTAELDNLTLTAQPTSAVVGNSNRAITLTQPAWPKRDAEPMQFRSDWGVELSTAGVLTIGADTSDVPENPRTIEIWICRTSAATAPVINQTGTIYQDGVAGALSLNVGQWTLVHIVTAAAVTGTITITGPAIVGQVSVYPVALSAGQVAAIDSAYAGYTKVTATETNTITVSEGATPAKIYAYDWAISGAG